MLPNLLSWFHRIVECVKTLRFTATYYIETSNRHRHFCDMVKHELRVTSWKLKNTSWNSKVRVQIHELRIKIHRLLVQILELKRIILSIKTRVNRLKISSFSKILSLKSFSNSWGNSCTRVSGDSFVFYFSTISWLRQETKWVNINFERRNLISAQKSHPSPDVCFSFLIVYDSSQVAYKFFLSQTPTTSWHLIQFLVAYLGRLFVNGGFKLLVILPFIIVDDLKGELLVWTTTVILTKVLNFS